MGYALRSYAMRPSPPPGYQRKYKGETAEEYKAWWDATLLKWKKQARIEAYKLWFLGVVTTLAIIGIYLCRIYGVQF